MDQNEEWQPHGCGGGIGGTSSPGSIWFPFDWHRPSRDRIFRAALRNGKAIGFTVEESPRVIGALRGLGLIGSDETATGYGSG